MQDWTQMLAEALGEQPLTGSEVSRLLDAAREVAHGVERKVTPLSAFLLGCAVGRRTAEGAPRGEAFDACLATLRAALPAPGEG